MCTDFLDPDGDVPTPAWSRSGEDSNYKCIDNAVRQPNTDSITDDYVFLSSGQENQIDTYTLSAPDCTTGANSAIIWIYGKTSADCTIEADFDGDGTLWHDYLPLIDAGMPENWYGTEFTSAHIGKNSWTAEGLANAKFRIRGNTDVDGEVYAYAIYIELTNR